jgi:putative membrane protein
VEHLTFVGFGILLWAQVIASPPFRPALAYPGRIAYLVAAMVPNVALSMLLAFSRSPLYPFYAELAHRSGGISAFTDQQIAAGIMWSFGDLPFVIAIVVLAVRWLGQVDKDASEQRAEAPTTAGARAGWRLT